MSLREDYDDRLPAEIAWLTFVVLFRVTSTFPRFLITDLVCCSPDRPHKKQPEDDYGHRLLDRKPQYGY